MSKGDLNQLLENENMLQWVWAANEQRYLFDKHDAYWINAAANGWTDDSFYGFLNAYGLLRGIAGALFSKSDKKNDEAKNIFVELCKEIYIPSLDDADLCQCANSRWKKMRSALKNKIAIELKRQKRPLPKMNEDFLPSATLKAFWFHHPDKLPMYDRFTFNALKEYIPGTKVFNFLRNFYDFYDEQETHINDTEAYFSRVHPYRHRIAEKFLWLEGNTKTKKDTLERFKASIAMREARHEAQV